jgi:hypothetical protein
MPATKTTNRDLTAEVAFLTRALNRSVGHRIVVSGRDCDTTCDANSGLLEQL